MKAVADLGSLIDDARCEGTPLAMAEAQYQICILTTRALHQDEARAKEILANSSQKHRHAHARSELDRVAQELPDALERRKIAHAAYADARAEWYWRIGHRAFPQPDQQVRLFR